MATVTDIDINIYIKNKTYSTLNLPQHVVIKNLRLRLKTNEFTCLMGPSGCGKTTLLNILANLDANYQGEVLLGQKQIKPKIGYIFQNPRLLPWCTARKNIELVLAKNQSIDIIDSLFESMQLSDKQNVFPEHLSLGMSRRVSIIRAFAINPDILLMDEPFVSLDSPTFRLVSNLLIKLWQRRPHIILFVTHNLREAITLADKLVFLSPLPTSVIAEVKVGISREERGDASVIEEFSQQLTKNYPIIKNLL